jgi:uncharacterized protein (DUF433 family)
MPFGAAHRFTPQEAAALTGVKLQRLQNALTERQLGRSFRAGADGRRRIDLPGMMTFAAMERMPHVRVAPEALYRAFKRTGGLPRGPVEIDDAVVIDAPRLLAQVVSNLALYERAQALIVSDPTVMGGVPVIKGTRIPARTLHARVKGGDPVDTILAEYPYLDRQMLDAAVFYVEANPARGRPPATKKAIHPPARR